MDVIDIIVKNDYCIGCGICSGICPHENLYHNWSSFGELIPHRHGECKKCNKCLESCPFYDHDTNQNSIADELFSNIPNIKYNKSTGYYLKCFAGYVKNKKYRLNSSSGGLATKFLATLLKKGIVDHIIAVGAVNNSDHLFEFRILDTPNEVYNCAGSSYYPVDLSKMIKKLSQDDGKEKYAIIALPCFVYGLRLAMKNDKKLMTKLKIIVSLTCGQLKNRFYSELLSVESGIPIEDLKKINFRKKVENQSSSNYSIIPFDKNDNEGKAQPFENLPSHLWHYKYFTCNACNYCDDVFGELAEITFMDGWLPEYTKDYKGTSIVITRDNLCRKLLKEIQDKDEIFLTPIEVESVLQSQKGVIFNKNKLLSAQLYRTQKIGKWHPKKRIHPDHDAYKKHKEFLDLTLETQELSKEIWPQHRRNKSNKQFWQEMRFLRSKIKHYEKKNMIKTLLKPKMIFNHVSYLIKTRK